MPHINTMLRWSKYPKLSTNKDPWIIHKTDSSMITALRLSHGSAMAKLNEIKPIIRALKFEKR